MVVWPPWMQKDISPQRVWYNNACSGFVLFIVNYKESLITVSLHNLLFFGYHGLHEEEKILGGEFEVNVELFYEEPIPVISSIEQTIDYSSVYNLIKNRMSKPTLLLETIAMELSAEIKKTFPVTNEIIIRIKKVKPPIMSFTGSVEVCHHQKF